MPDDRWLVGIGWKTEEATHFPQFLCSDLLVVVQKCMTMLANERHINHLIGLNVRGNSVFIQPGFYFCSFLHVIMMLEELEVEFVLN